MIVWENKIKKTVLITGSAGFIGFHLSEFFLFNKWNVIGLDAMTNYYDVSLKKDRNKILSKNDNFFCYQGFVQDQELINEIFSKHKPKLIIHLAAQPGVRYSIENPSSYVESNLIGTFHILEIARKFKPFHLLIASTSSVYGANNEIPFFENQKTDTPISFYAATKKSNEIMAHSYSHLYNIPTTIFRFFTVYGPWGRPDMALFKFTKNILLNKSIDIYNKGEMSRDFTYIDDLVKVLYLLVPKVPLEVKNRKKTLKNDSISNVAPFRIVNIGNSDPVNLNRFISELEKTLGRKAKKNYLGMQDGEICKTHSNIDLLKSLIGSYPKTSINEGIFKFVNWYKKYYCV